MKQPHTEEAINHTDDQQNTGNHKRPGVAGRPGADLAGRTRSGAENVEKPRATAGSKRDLDR